MYTVYVIFVVTLVLSFCTGSIVLIVSHKTNNQSEKVSNAESINNTIIDIDATSIVSESDSTNTNKETDYDYDTPYIIATIGMDEDML